MTISRRAIKNAPAVTFIALLVACAGTAPGARPDDMSARQHRDQAQAHASSAQDHDRKYDPSQERPRPFTRARAETDALDNPTQVHRRHAADHRRHAEQHAEAAAELENFRAVECGKIPPATRAVCPLVGAVERVEDVHDGVRLVLFPDARTDAVVEHMRCHYAFGREPGRQGMDQCPLYVRDIRIERGADGRSVTITSSYAQSIELLRQRARAHAGS